MELQTMLHIWNDLTWSKNVIERLVNENLENKLDNYLNKFKKSDAVWTIDFTVDKNKKWLFNAKLQINLDWKRYRYEREDYKKLDDLINNLFVHFKEELSKE